MPLTPRRRATSGVTRLSTPSRVRIVVAAELNTDQRLAPTLPGCRHTAGCNRARSADAPGPPVRRRSRPRLPPRSRMSCFRGTHWPLRATEIGVHGHDDAVAGHDRVKSGEIRTTSPTHRLPREGRQGIAISLIEVLSSGFRNLDSWQHRLTAARRFHRQRCDGSIAIGVSRQHDGLGPVRHRYSRARG